MSLPKEVPIGPDGDVVERLLRGETVRTGDLATFLILKVRCPEFEVCDVWPQRVTGRLREDHPELTPVTDRMIVSIRLDVERFRRRLPHAPEGSTEQTHLAFFINEAQERATGPLAHSVGPLLASRDLKEMSRILRDIETIADRRIRKEDHL